MKTLISSVPLAMCVALSSLAAQTGTDNSGSGSVTYFSESKTTAPGGSSTSTTYALTGMVGEQGSARSTSTTYDLAGGFSAMVPTNTFGPWLISVNPLVSPPRGTGLVWLSGTRLDLGNAPTVKVSGRPATVVAKSGTDIAVRLPTLSAPGWHQIELTNSQGVTSLERGLAVLPLLYTEGAPGSNVPFDLIFKGTKNDLVFWGLGFNPGPKIPLLSYLHGLTISTSFVRILPSFVISATSGEFRMRIPPVPFNFPIFTQALFVTNDAGYAPGSFSNMLRFF